MLRVFAHLVVILFVQNTFANSALAQSSWQEKLGTFRIGILGKGRPAAEIERMAPFKKAVGDALSIPVEIISLRDHRTLMLSLINSRIDYAMLSTTAFSVAWNECKCLEPIAAPVSADGGQGFYSVIVTHRNDSNATSISALKSKPVIVPGMASFSGYQFPKLALAKDGIELGADWPVDDQKTMEAAINAFVDDKQSTLISWIPVTPEDQKIRGVYARLQEKGVSRDMTTQVWQSQLIIHGPHTVRADLSGEAKVILLDMLGALQALNPEAYDAVEPNFEGGFQPVRLEDYQPVIDVLTKQKSPAISADDSQ